MAEKGCCFPVRVNEVAAIGENLWPAVELWRGLQGGVRDGYEGRFYAAGNEHQVF